MGWIGRVLSFVRVQRNDAKVSDVQIDTGGGPTFTAEHFATPGDDAHPLETDYVAGHAVQQTGRSAILGYADPINTPKALAGDKRIYSRDANTGQAVADVWLKSDGTAVISNENGTVTLAPNGSVAGANASGGFELQTGGDFVVNGVTIAADGSVTIPTSLTLNGKEIEGHTHAINGGSSAPGPTGANN